MKLKTANTIVVLWLIAILVAAWLAMPSKPLTQTTKKVRVDSISREARYSFLPSMVWKYHTKHGVLTSEIRLYKVGDSLELKIYKIKK